MTRTGRRLVWAGLSLVALATLFLGGLYWATQHDPGFYSAACQTTEAAARTANDELLQKASALASEVTGHGRWKAVFTQQELNGWMAVDLQQNHPEALPPSLSDPRLSIEGRRLIVAARYRSGSFSTVLSVELELYLESPNNIAICLRKVRAGSLPLPMQKLLDRIAEALANTDLRPRWKQADGDPVLVVTIRPRSQSKRELSVDTLHLEDGKAYLAGGNAKQ